LIVELYLPEAWAGDAARRTEAGIPEEVEFATKSRLARRMIARALAAGVGCAWVTGDSVYGNDGKLRQWLEERRLPFVLGVTA
jgi:SRSO17 transposase